MQNFEFNNPTKVIFGRDTIEQIGEELAQDGHQRVLLIAGGGSCKENGAYDQVTSALDKFGIAREEAWGVQANPVLSKVLEMIAQAKEADVDAILCLGGGSVIDSGKAVAAGFHLDDLWEAFVDHRSIDEALPLYSVLTISATGSECNSYAVITNSEEEKKWPVGGPALYPRATVIDPTIQFSLPWHQTVNGALDAIAHILEYYFLDETAETTLALNESLIATILKVTDRLRDEPDHYASRASLAWAATLALNGISGAGLGHGDWATHSIEHGLSARHPEIAHGAGLGVVFPAWILFCHETKPELFARWAKNIWGADNVTDGVTAFRNKIKSWGAPTTLGELKINPEEIPEIAANIARVGMLGAIKKLRKKSILQILNLAN